LLLAGDVRSAHIEQFAEMLAGIHRRSADRQRELRPMFEDRTFFETLRLEPYYGYAATQVPASAGFIGELVVRTRNRQLTLVHGDYSPKNVLIYENQLVLLDHEVIHWGDPAFDVGFSLTHLLSKAHHLPDRRAEFTAAARQYWSEYCRGVCAAPWADGLEKMCAWHTLGCLLARVAGRSPLEYLDDAERDRQQSVVLSLMQEPPGSVLQLIETFVKDI
jgi:aminoglycoside phosphotransferase (APT) family kinase protein